MSKWNKCLLCRLGVSEEHHTFKNNHEMKHLFYAIALGSVLGIALVSSPPAVADPGNEIYQRVGELEAKGEIRATLRALTARVAELEAKDKIRATLHTFVAALNSAFISGARDPLAPIAVALHPEIELYATPPPTPLDPVPVPTGFLGIDQVIAAYGQGVVANIRPNILASAMDVQLLTEVTAEANLRFANSVSFPAGCTPGSPGCTQVMLFADVHVAFELSSQDVWQVARVDLVHYLAHVGPPPMIP